MEKILKYKSTQIYYHVYGKGNCIVLLHGFGEDSTIFNNQVTFLSPHYKVIVPDLPGSGKSSLLKSDAEIGMEDYADCIHALLKSENIEKCILLGHSMGGYITMAFAEKYLAMLDGFGLIHSSAAADTDEKKQSRMQGIKMISQYGAAAFLKTTTPALFAESFKQRHPALVEDLISKNAHLLKEALIQYYTAMMKRPDRTEILKSTPLPVLFVLGKQDPAAPFDVVINQVHLPSTSHIHILDDVAHMSMLEATEELNKFIFDFAGIVFTV